MPLKSVPFFVLHAERLGVFPRRGLRPLCTSHHVHITTGIEQHVSTGAYAASNDIVSNRGQTTIYRKLIVVCPLLFPQDLTQAKKMVGESVAIYNCERPHLSLRYQTPDAMHRAFG